MLSHKSFTLSRTAAEPGQPASRCIVFDPGLSAWTIEWNRQILDEGLECDSSSAPRRISMLLRLGQVTDHSALDHGTSGPCLTADRGYRERMTPGVARVRSHRLLHLHFIDHTRWQLVIWFQPVLHIVISSPAPYKSYNGRARW